MIIYKLDDIYMHTMIEKHNKNFVKLIFIIEKNNHIHA